jgi:putative transposase
LKKDMSQLLKRYNKEHLHSGIKFVTPAQRHERLDKEILRQRYLVPRGKKKTSLSMEQRDEESGDAKRGAIKL